MPRGRRPRHDRGAVRSEVFFLAGRPVLSAEFPTSGRLNIIYFRDDLGPADRERAAAWLAAAAGDLGHDAAYDLLWSE